MANNTVMTVVALQQHEVFEQPMLQYALFPGQCVNSAASGSPVRREQGQSSLYTGHPGDNGRSRMRTTGTQAGTRGGKV